MKMSNIILLSLLGLGVITSFSIIYGAKKEFKIEKEIRIEGSANLKNKILDLGVFQSIKSYDQMKVILIQGDPHIEISAEDNLLEFVSVENKEGVLEISRIKEHDKTYTQNIVMVVKISNPSYEKIEGFQQSDIYIEGELKQESLELNMFDQSGFEGSLEIGNFRINLKNQSKAKISGMGETLNLEIMEQARLEAKDMKANEVQIKMSQQSDANFEVIKSISGDLYDNSKLSITGNPQIEQLNTHNQAKIKRRG